MIRRAKKSDISRINSLLEQVLMVHYEGRPDLWKKNAKKYTDSELIEIIDDNSRPIFVYADENENVLGYAFCIFEEIKNNNVRKDIKTLYIDDLCVDETQRKKHIGSALYNFVVDFAKENGCYNITLNVWQSNPNAYSFYNSMGLVPLKTCLEKVL